MSIQDDTSEPFLVPTPVGFRTIGVRNTKGWELIKAGEIETVSIGRRRLIVWSSLKAYVERLRSLQAAKRP
jgi:hypothetical protein